MCRVYVHGTVKTQPQKPVLFPFPPPSPQVTDRSEATAAAVESMEVKHGEPLVVQFAAP